MKKQDQVLRHIKTHSERSADDRDAVGTLLNFLKSKGRINANFSTNDTWPNIDGTFEFVSNPDVSRKPEQNFIVQIKGTHNYTESNGEIKYSLQSLGFPAYVYDEVTLDPGILFLVLNGSEKGCERVFWKYLSEEFLNSIDFEKNSKTITFSAKDEIKCTDESIYMFCNQLCAVIEQHTFVKKLDDKYFEKEELLQVIQIRNEDIEEKIDKLDIYNETRDSVSKRLLSCLDDLCKSTLLLNSIEKGNKTTTLRLAYEQSILNIETKYLGVFLRGLVYINNRVPRDGQSERLMRKYYNFLWQIRKFLNENFQVDVIKNLEKFPLDEDATDNEYYSSLVEVIKEKPLQKNELKSTRYYIQKNTPFFVGKERYFEITLQLAETYATKYNRITVYTAEEISTNYSINIAFEERNMCLWSVNTKIKIVTNWKVAIDPTSMNKLAKILLIPMKISKNYGEYNILMQSLTETGLDLLEIVDMSNDMFNMFLDRIYTKTNTANFRMVLQKIHAEFSYQSKNVGKNVIRFLIQHLRNEDCDKVMVNKFASKLLVNNLYLSSKCYPFEKKPFLSNLVASKTNNDSSIVRVLGDEGTSEVGIMLPYLKIRSLIKDTGEIYYNKELISTEENIEKFNVSLDVWEKREGHAINSYKNFVFIESYEKSTLNIIKSLRSLSFAGNAGQAALNEKFIKENMTKNDDPLKVAEIRNAFVKSKLLMIYGAAGTGKTFLINYLSNLMGNRRKLFLTKTHTARQNLVRNIKNPGAESEFISIDRFTKKVNLPDYDVIFVDECSTIDNLTMERFMDKISPNTFIVLAGDIHQIESINFGNWFYYAKNIITASETNIELLSTWRTNDESLKKLWNEVREKRNLITEMLAIDGPFSENITSKIFESESDDEVVLCLNYDGKFGLNNINSYFQTVNNQGPSVSWKEWVYKKGDYILFNETERFKFLYNNLKGRIVDIFDNKQEKKIEFTIDVNAILTEQDCRYDEIEYVETIGEQTRVRFSIFTFEENIEDADEQICRELCVVPFQLAYAVSIHKAQGLEYDSVKIIIPKANSEKISHSIFYTAITRAKKKLKIYWSTESMNEIVDSFSMVNNSVESLEIIKEKLKLN